MTDEYAREAFFRSRAAHQNTLDQTKAREAFQSARSRHRTALPGAVLGDDFDPEGTASIGMRFDLSRGDTMEEKRERVKRRFPEGDVKVIDDPGFGAGQGVFRGGGQQILTYRESPKDKWKRVDPEGFIGDVLGDTVEAIGPSVEAIVGETAMAVRSRGLSVVGTIARQVFGAVAGEAAEQGTQYLTGKQKQSPWEVGGEVATEAALSAAGGLIASPFSAVANIKRGGGALRVGDEGREVIQAANRLDPEIGGGLTPGMVTDNPALRLSERQAAALLPGLGRRYRDLVSKVDQAVTGTIDNAAKAQVINRTAASLGTLQRTFLNRIRSGGTPTDGGRALQQGIDEFNAMNRNLVKQAYDAARSIQEPTFDFKGIKDTAADLKKGSKGTLDSRVAGVISEINGIKAPITLRDGSVLSITDQLRNARTQLNSLRHVEPGKIADQTNGQANDLLRSIDATLDSPTNPDPAFRDAWAEANKMNREWREFTDKAVIMRASKSENPSDLLTYAAPGNSENLRTIKSVVPGDKWRNYQGAVYADLLSDPAKTLERLNAYDKETLDVLMPPREQEAFRQVAQELDRIHQIGADEIAERMVTNKNFINKLVERAEPRDVHTLMRAANETNDTAMRDSVRSAIVEWAWDGVIGKGKGGLIFNQGALAGRVEKLKASGLWRMLTPEQRQIVGDAEIVGRAFSDMIDAGTSIRAAEAVAGAQSLKPSALMTFIHAGMIGQFYTSELGRRMLVGGGLPHSNGSILRLIGGVLTTTVMPEDVGKLAEEQRKQYQNDSNGNYQTP